MTKAAKKKKPHGQTRALKNFAPKENRDDLARAREQASAQFNSIAEMVEALKKAQTDSDSGDGRQTHSDDVESAERTIQEDALSVQVRSGWFSPWADSKDVMRKPCEFEILLCTGGPAVRIVGELGEYEEPEKAHIEFQDWFTPWTRWDGDKTHTYEQVEKTVLAYCRCFYFGGG